MTVAKRPILFPTTSRPTAYRCAAHLSAIHQYAILATLFFVTTGCTKFDLLNATIPRWGSTLTTDICYGPLERQKLDVYRPHGVAPGASIVIFFYGGHWQAGSKNDYRFAAQAITSQGFVAVLPDYRLYPQATFPAFVEDAALAVRWVHDHATQIGGDPKHIYLMGHSAGAHIVALLNLDADYLQQVGLDRNAIRATIGLSGPYDFLPLEEDRPVFNITSSSTQQASRPSTQPTNQPATSPTLPMTERVTQQATPQTDPQIDPLIEPINFVDGKAPPMLLIHGQRDQTVSPANSQILAAKIHSTGGRAKLILYPDSDHVGIVLSLAWPFHWLAPTLHDVTNFIREDERER